MTFELYYPVKKPVSINQGFGVNPEYYAKFGIKGHNGLDLFANHGDPVYAAHDGMAYYEVDANQGDGFIIKSTQTYDYNGDQVYFKTVYWHLCAANDPEYKPLIPTDGKGYAVKAGDLLGYADNTGAPYESNGTHLHFALKPQAKQGEPDYIWYNVDQNNGFMGAIDPSPYLNGLYAGEINKVIHTFYLPLKYGDQGSEVLELQRLLQKLSYFPLSEQCTGYYGSITSSAVFAFQKDHVITGVYSFIAVWSSLGRNVGTLTIPALNKIQ